MADEGIFATTAEVVRKAGTNANATIIADEAATNDFIAQAESVINTLSMVNWSNIYSGLDTETKMILKAAATAFAGNKLISYDMSGYTSRFEAETMLDVNKDDFNIALALLKDQKKRRFIENPTDETT